MLCARSVLLLWLGCVMNVRWGLEQPHGSIAECMPRLQQFFGVTDATCHTDGGLHVVFSCIFHKYMSQRGTKRDACNHVELNVARLKPKLLQGVSWRILDDEFWRTYGKAAYVILQ